MTIQLPKDLRGFTNPRVMPADFNTFDPDSLLPSLYFKVVSNGNSRAKLPNDPAAIDTYLRRLASQRDLVTNQSSDLRVLDRLIRTSVANIGKAGEGGTKGERIRSIDESTLLSFKPGFPFENTAVRRVDAFVYSMLSQRYTGERIRDLFVETLGKGIVLTGSPVITGQYDGVTTIDSLTRLSILYLAGFEDTGIRKGKTEQASVVLLDLASHSARLLGRFLETFGLVMPPRALTHHLKALIAFDLFIYTIKLLHAVPALVQSGGELPGAMRRASQEASPPSLYCDFTLRSGQRSHEMAVASVQRDLAQVEPFIHAVLHLRQLEEYLRDLDGSDPERVVRELYGDQPDDPAMVAAMLRVHAESDYRADIEAMARTTRRDIVRYTGDAKKSGGATDDPINDLAEIELLTAGSASTLDAVVRLLVDAQSKQVNSQITNWFSSVGAISKPYGMLRGVVGGRGRLQWRYQPTNDLLATLVMVASVDTPEWDDADPRPRPIRLQDFLTWLERQFGILVDRPPEPFSGAEYQAAAQDNLRAMLGRLRQMGIFRDLSDDFTVQRLIPPYSEAVDGRPAHEESTRW